jgi:hypothetical protein
VIDYEAVAETRHGDWFDRLTALLIGFLAVLAASLVLVQVDESQAQARANANVSRINSELTTWIIASGSLSNAQLVSVQRANQLGIEGAGRQIVGLGRGDETMQAIGAANFSAGLRLATIAHEMNALSDAASPLDPYALRMLTLPYDMTAPMVDGVFQLTDEMKALLAELDQQDLAAADASARSNYAVLGLSVVALSGVFVGLAAVVGSGRAGRLLLVLAWIAGLASVGLLSLAIGLVVPPALPPAA